MSILSGLRASPPIEIIGRGTKTIPVPDNCVAYEIYLWSGGGSGGAARDADYGRKVSGGSAGGYANIKRVMLTGVTSLTAVLGAPGAAVTVTTDTSTNGNNASSSTVTDGTVTLTVPGGKGGKANVNTTAVAAADPASTPTVSDSGDINTAIGGTSGANTSGNATKDVATGGGSAAGPWGDGKNSGSVIGAFTGATGAASPFFVSGDVLGDGFCTGGAGQGGKSGDATTALTCGGGALGPSANNDSTIPGAGAPVRGYQGSGLTGGPLFVARGAGAGGETGLTTPIGMAGGPGGGGGTNVGTTGAAAAKGAGGHMGGGGGHIHNGSGLSDGFNNGGAFAGGGGSIFWSSASTLYTKGGKGGLGSGGGGGTTRTGTSATSGEGGEPYICVTFFVRD